MRRSFRLRTEVIDAELMNSLVCTLLDSSSLFESPSDAEGQHIAKNVRFRIMVSPLCQGLSHGWSLGTGLPARQSESLLQTNFPSPGSGRVTGCLVTLAQEKGAYSVLKMVHQRMIKHWRSAFAKVFLRLLTLRSLEGPLGPTYASTTHLPPMPVSAGFDSPVPVISYAKSSM